MVFTNANCRKSDLEGAEMHHSIFKSVNPINVNFKNCSLKSADFQGD